VTASHFRPRYVTFDCYGTLIDFRMSRVAEEVIGDRLNDEVAQDFLQAFAAYRLDEVMGDWKPYRNVVADALRRAMNRYGLDYRDADAEPI
jgi:2-haloacid dehalogenase